LKLNDIEVQIQILNKSIAWCLGFERFRSPDGWLSAGAVVRRLPSGTHHADKVSLDDRVSAGIAPNLRVVFNGISIKGRFQR
jgi:hypothetical protein